MNNLKIETEKDVFVTVSYEDIDFCEYFNKDGYASGNKFVMIYMRSGISHKVSILDNIQELKKDIKDRGIKWLE
jgi:hypothetical protein